MIVVDTNIIGYLYLESDRSLQAELAFIKHPHWAAPLILCGPLRSVLALYIRKKFIALEDAVRNMDEAMNIMSNYEFVALAQDLGVPLITIDKQILDQFPADAVSLEEYVSK
jgi:predicted nucleic acid-binding protein